MPARLIYTGTLPEDLRSMPVRAVKGFQQAVRRNVTAGNKLAQEYARAKAGPHGSAYWKRLSGEMTGPLTGEYGPEEYPKSEYVGVGFRHGVNMDLPNSADVIGPKLAKDADAVLDGLFW